MKPSIFFLTERLWANINEFNIYFLVSWLSILNGLEKLIGISKILILSFFLKSLIFLSLFNLIFFF